MFHGTVQDGRGRVPHGTEEQWFSYVLLVSRPPKPTRPEFHAGWENEGEMRLSGVKRLDPSGEGQLYPLVGRLIPGEKWGEECAPPFKE